MYILIHCYFTVTRRNYLLSSPCQTATSPLPLWLAPDVCTSQRVLTLCTMIKRKAGRLRLKRDGTRAETRFRLSAKRTSPFKSVGASVQSTADSRGVRISGSNAGYTMFGGSVRVLATHSIRQFPVYVLTRASPCAITFQLDSTLRQPSPPPPHPHTIVFFKQVSGYGSVSAGNTTHGPTWQF